MSKKERPSKYLHPRDGEAWTKFVEKQERDEVIALTVFFFIVLALGIFIGYLIWG